VGVSGTGTLTMTGGLVTVGGTLSRGTFGTINLNAGGTLQIGTGGTTGALAVSTLSNNGTLVFSRSDASTYAGTISGSGVLTKLGAGTLTLSGSSSFTGGTTIDAGVVVVQNTKALGSGGVTVSSGGTLLVDGIDLDLGGAAVALVTGAELQTTSGARVAISGSSDLSGVRSTSPGVTSAAILAGTAVSGTLATTWTTTADAAVQSAVLILKTPTSAANPFALSLSYAAGLDASEFFLGWDDPESGDWVNAVVGNELLEGMTAASGDQLGYLGSFADFQSFYGTNLFSYLGAYGRDETGRAVWAVINHNSEFAVTAVPEPATWALALAGLAGVGISLRRRKR
jgi:autotransporter-associated beta strand protein